MAVVMARPGLNESAQAGPPAAQPDIPVQMELPVLFEGYRPPDLSPTRRRRRRPRPKDAMRPSMVQLDLGLVLAELLEEDRQADRAARELDAIEGEVACETWEQAEVLRLHMFLLERSIEILADPRTGAGTVLEILDWMREPPRTPGNGFSYRVCCQLAGYDADLLFGQIQLEVERLHGLMAA